MGFPDFYKVLGLPRYCDNQDEIYKAYRKKMERFDGQCVHGSGFDMYPHSLYYDIWYVNVAYLHLSSEFGKHEYDLALSQRKHEKPFRKPLSRRMLPVFLCSLIVLGYVALVIANKIGWPQAVPPVEHATAETAKPATAPALTQLKPSQKSGSESTAQGTKDIPRTRPDNGKIYLTTGTDNCSELEVRTRSGPDYLIKLEGVYDKTNLVLFYVRGGMSCTVPVSPGTYCLKYACGEEWYGLEKRFGPTTTYEEASSVFIFTETKGWEVDLYLVPDGNLRTQTISKEEF